MCQGCWENYGSPQIDNRRVRDAVKLIAAVYEESLVGGWLHTQIDDFNLEDDYFDKEAEDRLETEAEKKCFDYLKAMSVDERTSALALHYGYWHMGEAK